MMKKTYEGERRKMLIDNYQLDMSCWSGRVDSEDDYDAFRWHQWVQPLDLSVENISVPECKLGFAFIGFCGEQGVKRNKGRIGTASAPNIIREQMSSLPCNFSREVKLYDAGNIVCEKISLEQGQKFLGQAVNKLLSLGLFPIVLGGGHETTFGHYQGQLEYAKKEREKPDLAIVNFDAHFDIRPYQDGASSGSMFRQIADICKEQEIPFGYMPIGIQQHSNTIRLFKTAEELGVDYILAKRVQNSSYAAILERVDYFMYQHERAYMTVCMDVFSSAFAPAVSAPQSLGLNPEVVIPIIKHILRTRKVVGFDICEISPRFDLDNTTANLGATIIFTVVSTLCKLNNLPADSHGDLS